MTDQRKFSRVTFDAESILHVKGSALSAHLLDISLKGALLDIGAAAVPARNSEAVLELRLTGSDVVIRMNTRVARLENTHVGLRCESIDLDSMAHLRRLLELNSGDPELVERELSALI